MNTKWCISFHHKRKVEIQSPLSIVSWNSSWNQERRQYIITRGCQASSLPHSTFNWHNQVNIWTWTQSGASVFITRERLKYKVLLPQSVETAGKIQRGDSTLSPKVVTALWQWTVTFFTMSEIFWYFQTYFISLRAHIDTRFLLLYRLWGVQGKKDKHILIFLHPCDVLVIFLSL